MAAKAKKAARPRAKARKRAVSIKKAKRLPPGMVPLTTRVPKQLLVDVKVKCAAAQETVQDFIIRKLQAAVAS